MSKQFGNVWKIPKVLKKSLSFFVCNLPKFFPLPIEGATKCRSGRREGAPVRQLSNEKKSPGCLGYVRDYTTQLCGDYKKPV